MALKWFEYHVRLFWRLLWFTLCIPLFQKRFYYTSIHIKKINEGTTIQLWKIVTYRPWHCQRYYASITVMNRARGSWYINNHVYFRIIFLVFNWFEILVIHVRWKLNLNSTKLDVLAWLIILSWKSLRLRLFMNLVK